MESAGALSAHEIALFADAKRFQRNIAKKRRPTIGVLVGPGHNGADGLVVARHLLSRGFVVWVLAVQPKENPSPLWSLQKNRLQNSRLQNSRLQNSRLQNSRLQNSRLQNSRLQKLASVFHVCSNLEEFERKKQNFAETLRCNSTSGVIWVDALFGIGLNQELSGLYREACIWINKQSAQRVSLDTPSGLNVDTGVAQGVTVKADLTLTFGGIKPGFLIGDGPSVVGRIKYLPIGFPQDLRQKTAGTHFLFTQNQALSVLPKRNSRSHKAKNGKLLVLAGSPSMWGAGLLAAESAFRVGAGYVVWGAKEEPSLHLAQHPEIMSLDVANLEKISFAKYTAVAIGPGLNDRKWIEQLLLRLAHESTSGTGDFRLPVVVDAEALRVLAEMVKKGFVCPTQWILTPHSGELQDLVGVDAATIESDRCYWAQEAARKTKAQVLLKGFHSILATPERCDIVNAGDSALSKAGTGDVLTGVIAGFLAQRCDPREAALLGAYVHGQAAQKWVMGKKGRLTLVASDLWQQVVEVIAELENLRRFPKRTS